jgi:hypothetical protein
MTDLNGKDMGKLRKTSTLRLWNNGLGIGQYAPLPMCFKTTVIYLLSIGTNIVAFIACIHL